MKKVDAEFLDLEVYAIYKAVTELFGDRGWDVVWRSGEIVFQELKRRLNITETEPIALLRRLGRYFEEVGYLKRMSIEALKEDEFLYDMYEVSIHEGIMKLRAEEANPVLAHFSTTVMFAALKDMCNMTAEITHLEVEGKGEEAYGREKWKLKKIES